MFSAEVKVNGEFAKGVIRKQRVGYGSPEQYYADMSDINVMRAFDADDLRTLANELFNVADKLDELNGV